jgi:hypothetical protein
LLRDSVDVELNIQRLRNIIIWARDDGGYRLIELDDDSLKSLVFPNNKAFQEVLIHDDCQPGRGGILRLLLFVQQKRIDSVDFVVNDSMALDWMENFGPDPALKSRNDVNRTSAWSLLGINGDSVELQAREITEVLKKEIRRREKESGKSGQSAMQNGQRVKWLESYLSGSRNVHSETLQRGWKGRYISIDFASGKFQKPKFNPENLK